MKLRSLCERAAYLFKVTAGGRHEAYQAGNGANFLPIIAAETRGGDQFYPDWSAVKKVEPASSQNEPTPTQASDQQKSESEQSRSDVGAQKQLTVKPRAQASTNANAETGGVRNRISRS